MNYQYKKENGGLKVYLMDNGRKISDFELNKEECKELYANLCEILFDDMLEKNKDVLYRLKNNIPAPKMVSIDKVINFLNSTDFCQYYNKEFIDEFRRKMEE